MYRGRYQLGTHVPLAVLTVNGSNVPSAPASCPRLEVRTAAGAVVFGDKPVPVQDRYGAEVDATVFAYSLFLDGRFAAGLYTATYRYTLGSYEGVVVDEFEVVAGGDGDGAVIAMHYFDRPHAKFVVMQLDGGSLVKGRNPRV
jgi:hypothetical protein